MSKSPLSPGGIIIEVVLVLLIVSTAFVLISTRMCWLSVLVTEKVRVATALMHSRPKSSDFGPRWIVCSAACSSSASQSFFSACVVGAVLSGFFGLVEIEPLRDRPREPILATRAAPA